MENFNLIPMDLRWGKKRKIMVGAALIFFAVFAISFFILNTLLAVSRGKILVLQKETGQLQAGVESYNRLKKEMSVEETLLQGYENVLFGNAKVGDMLEDLHTVLPENTWFTEVEITAGENAVLTGYTDSLEGLEILTKLLPKQKYFEFCRLNNLQEEEHNGQSFLMFTIICKLL